MVKKMNLFLAAIEGINVTHDGTVVRVKDGHDMWLCRAEEWQSARLELSLQDASDDDAGSAEAYTALCAAIRNPVASINGSSRGDIESLVRDAYDAELIDADDARAYGFEVQL